MLDRNDIPVSGWEAFSLLIIFFVSLILISGSRLSRLSSSKAVSSSKPVKLYLEDSIDLNQLSSILADSGLVKDKKEVIWAGNLLGWRNFQKGHYQIDGNYSYDVLLSRMARGIQDPVALTVLPGLTEQRLIKTISRQMKFDSLSFSQTFNDTSFLSELEIDRKHLMGRMLPETYSIYWTISPKAVIEKIINEFDKLVIEPHRDLFEATDLTVDEIIILASIIEWEAKNNKEKNTISGLYWNRLKRGMKLQADPTVNYALNERRRLLYEDYKIDHPYNTYIYEGLPPGPITNPGLTSIEAALHPADHNYLYMVASPGGGHVFSETFEQHKKESAKWRKWLNEQYRKKRETELEKERNS